ncbi:hypothetical protein Y489_09240 [Listeria monocytogenes]|nr:hypothetical protein [Listeria monocytogenes]
MIREASKLVLLLISKLFYAVSITNNESVLIVLKENGVSTTKNNIDYIKTVQNIKSFFDEFQYLVFLLGSKNKIKLNTDGLIEIKVLTGN